MTGARVGRGPAEHGAHVRQSGGTLQARVGGRCGLAAAWLAAALLAVLSTEGSTAGRIGTRLPAEFRSWTFESGDGSTETITQLTVPLTVTMGLAPGAQLVVATAGGSARTDQGEGRLSLSGFADTEIQLYQNLPEASVVLFGGVQLPSGVSALSPDELEVSRRIANPILGMTPRQYGRGLDFNVGAVWSHPLTERARLSFGLGARLSGAYEVAAGTEDLDPGDQASATVEISFRSDDWERHRKSAAVGASVRVFGSDEQSGEVLFEEGAEVQLGARAELPLGAAEWRVHANAVVKSDNTSYERSGQLSVPRSLASGTGLWFDSLVMFPIRESFGIGPELRGRLFEGNDIENGDGWALELGPLLSIEAGAGTQFDLRGAYLLGSMGTGDEALDLSGFAVGVGTTWRIR